MAAANEIRPRLLQLVADELGLPADSVTGELSVEQLGLDSLAFVEIVVMIEQELGVHVAIERIPVELSPSVRLDELLTFVMGAIEDPPGGSRTSSGVA